MPEKIWTYYDANGDRVKKRHAIFAGKEVVTAARISGGHASVHRVEYRDVYHVARPDDRRHFASKKPMLLWFNEVAATLQGRGRTEHRGSRAPTANPAPSQRGAARD